MYDASRPSVVIRATLSLPAVASLEALDEWLESAFELKLEPMPAEAGAAHPAAAAVLWRALLLAREFLQAARVAAFGPPEILSLAPAASQPSAWQAIVALPRVEQVLVRVYSLAFQAGVETVRTVATLPCTAAEIGAVQDAVAAQVIGPLRALVPAGESALHVLRAAHAVDIPFVHLGNDVHLLGWGRRGRLIDRSATTHDSALGARVTRNKHLAAAILRQAGLPTPVHELVTDLAAARAAAARLGYPVVVKPLDGERGEGVTTGVADEDALATALAAAERATASRQVLVEREVAGVCHRLFMVAGRLLYAVKRLPQSVFGDGRGTVAELVAAAAAREAARPPWRRGPAFVLDELAERSLAAAGLQPGTVPAAGARVALRPIESTAWGGHDEDVTAVVHSDTVALARRAAEVFGLEVAGIDLVSTDIARPWHDTGAVITEVNFAPLLGGHAISRAAIPGYLRLLVEVDGRIPVEAFVGGEAAWAAARLRQATLVAEGVDAFLTSHEASLDAAGLPLPLAVRGVRDRCRALLLDRRVAAIVLVVQSDECASGGLPVDRVTAVRVVDRLIMRHEQPAEPAAAQAIEAVIDRLQELLRPAGTDRA
jgi:cyanophycin synthetase